jgi:hypothetical protein
MEITLDSLAFVGVIAAQFLAVITSGSWGAQSCESV